jgi:RNA polymerase sigma-70 factor (ECF subfamily)
MIGKKDFVALVDEKSSMLYHVARTILKNDEDCKDALQESLLKAWENRHKLRDLTLFGTWVTRILINECHTFIRKKRKYLLRDEVEAAYPSRAPDPALQWALESLPEKLRLPLVLHYMEGYTYEQISQMLHIPESTVRSRLSRARDALRLDMESEKEAWLHEAQ